MGRSSLISPMSTTPAASSPDPFRIFLSGSTADFGQTRLSLRDALARGQLHVIHQADFPQTQADTVLKLAQLIVPCGVLIHLIGRKPGSVADQSAVTEYLALADKDGGFLKDHADLRAALGDFSGITYTQWEVLIALHLGITVFVYGDATHGDPAHPQRVHLDRLVTARRYSDTFADESDLFRKVMADLMFHYRQTLPSAEVPAIFRPSNLPGMYANCLFVGRDSFLDDLCASLLKKTHATAITQAPAATGISGLGGIGKTHAAVEYARRHQADYSAQLFISGGSPERLSAGFSALYEVLQLGTQDEVQPDESIRVTAALRWLASNCDWLLIVDNVDDEAAAAALAGYFGQLSKGHVLITTCLQNWADNVESLPIHELSPDVSTDLLLQLTEKKRRRAADDATQARHLADLMEGLPLALHQAAGYINEQRLTFRDYIAIYEKEATDPLGWFKSHIIHYERPDMLAPKPVLITWKTSFDKLDEDARFWLLVFSHFAPEPIPEFLLDSAPDANDEVKTRHSATKKAIAQAESYSLLTRYDAPPRFKLHRLVQHIIRLTAPEADRSAAIAIGIQLIAESKPGDPSDVHTWLRWNPLQAHAIFLAAIASDISASVWLSWLLTCLALLLKTKAKYSTAEPYYHRALRLDEADYGPDHPMVAIDLNNLATFLIDTGRPLEAEPLMLRALMADEVSYGPMHPKIALRLSNIAALLQATNRLVQAEPLMQRALFIDEACFGADHPNVARSLNNLGGLLHATHRLEKAELLFRRALAITEAHFGPDHPQVGITVNNLGQVLQDTNRLVEAELLKRRALQIDEACFGPDHPTVAIRLNNLTQLLKVTDRLAEAEQLMCRVLQIDEASFGFESPKIGLHLNNLAMLYQRTNRLSQAEQLMLRALKISEANYGANHVTTATYLNNLARILQDAGRLAEAEPLLRRALVICVRAIGLKDPNSLGVQANYIILLKALKLPEAEIQQRVQAAVGGSLGPGAE